MGGVVEGGCVALAHAGLRCFSLAQPHSEVARLAEKWIDLGWGGGLEGVI